MKTWVIFALISMVFAGLTSVIAKAGLAGITGELGLAVRTIFVFAFVMLFSIIAIPAGAAMQLTRINYTWLGLSGLTTALSWIFYYKALKAGDVSTVALIDKGSVIIAVLLACLVLKEQITVRILLGGALIVTGLVIVAKK